MKNKVISIVLGLLLLVIFVLTFTKSPEVITKALEGISKEVRIYSAFVHILFILVLVGGMINEKIRNTLFPLFIAFISLSATIISLKYGILPNIILFTMFFLLIIHAYITKKLNFNFKNITPVNLFFGILGLTFGFWYLHWVESPIWLNALLYSPIGSVNCPTMLTICGFLCLSENPRSAVLETVVAFTTLYFGFFGLFRLGAYVDVAQIVCALFLIVRLSSYSHLESFFENKKKIAESNSITN